MKKLVIFCVVLALATSAFAQATVLFNNRVPAFGVDAPIYDLNVGGTKLEGSTFLAQLWVATTSQPDSFFPVGDAVDFRTGVAAGYVNVGVESSRTIPGVPFGDFVFAQIRAWTSVEGYSGYSDIANLAYTTSDPTIRFGFSQPVYMQTASSILMPPNSMVGLQSFAITAVPEPTPVVLFFLGGLGMFLFSWKLKKTVI